MRKIISMLFAVAMVFGFISNANAAKTLKSLRLYENPKLWADYQGNAMDAYLTIQTHFSAAHRLAREDLPQEG